MTIIKIVAHCLYQSFRHPNTPIVQAATPEPVKMSAIPWWGSGIILVIGIISWCLSAHWDIVPLGEAARAMVYMPLANMFGMGLAITGKVNK